MMHGTHNVKLTAHDNYNNPHFRRYIPQLNKLTEILNKRQYNKQWTFRAVFYGSVGNYTICKKNRRFAIHTGIITLPPSLCPCKMKQGKKPTLICNNWNQTPVRTHRGNNNARVPAGTRNTTMQH